MSPRVVAFVHAKGTSTRVPGKNLRMLGDRPLFCHAIAHARAAQRVDEVVIDSDSDAILSIGASHGARPLQRPARLATNDATGDDLAYWQASNAPGAEIVLQVVPTAPFLAPESIDAAVDLLREHGVDSVVGCRCEALYLWRGGRPAYFRPDGSIPNSYELEPLTWETTGLYANRAAAVLRLKKRMNPDSCLPLVLDPIEAVDIDTPEDFALAEALWRGLRGTTTAAPAAVATR
jgi:CMP-N-acetylneuraminic acid synthetase